MKTKFDYFTIPLIALMAMTRVHHFGSSFSLPDASLAVFFLAGFWFRSPYLLVFLLLEAGVMDYVAINHFQVSDWCVSPAYVFLIPTYAVLWFAGRYCSMLTIRKVSDFILPVGLFVLATTAAFVISNGSFYLFSGRFSDTSLGHYALSVAQYYPAYLGSTLIYSVLALSIVKMFRLLPALINHQKEMSL